MRPCLILAAAIAAALPAGAAAPGWAGTYTFENGMGRNAGGFYMSVDRKLTIGARGCRLDAQGYQTDEHILCRAVPTGNTLSVNFVSYANGKTENVYGVTLYRPGQALFTLTRTPRGLLTRWGAYKPDATRDAGVYFQARSIAG